MLPYLLWISSTWAHPVDGTWQLQPSTSEVTQRLHDSIEDALASWPSFAVAIAKRQITSENRPCQTYVLRVTAEQTQVTCEQHPPLSHIHGTTTTFADPKGRPIKSQARPTPDSLRLIWRGEEGRRIDTLTVQDDVLVMASKLVAPALPRAIRWTLHYTRPSSTP